MQKILWLDVETSGFSAKRNGILSIAAILVVDGVTKREWLFDREMNPDGREIDDGALLVNGFTREQISENENWQMVNRAFIEWLKKCYENIGDFEPAICGGYVNSFDIRFVENWFEASEVMPASYLIDCRSTALLDVHEIVRRSLHPSMVGLENKKLVTVAKALGVDLQDAHTALGDIQATIEVWKKLTGQEVVNV